MEEKLEYLVEISTEATNELVASFEKGPILYDDGRRLLTEKRVGQINGLKIEVFSNEHPPPHFRVKCGGETANFAIEDCRCLNGGLDKWRKNIQIWWQSHKMTLINEWNNMRPTDCPVGIYDGN